MAEAGEIVAIVLSTLGAQNVAGAPAKAVGEVLAERIKARLNRTLDKARDKGMGEPIADRVAVKVLNEAAFTDDDLTLEYLAGVMAASGPDDDTGAAVVAQIGRLSAVQLRFHYVVYRELKRLWPAGARMNLYMETEAKRAGVRLPVEDLIGVIGVPGVTMLGNIIPALVRERLLNDEFQFGAEPGNPPMVTARVRPTGPGAELFLWGHGEKVWDANRLLAPKLELQLLDIPATPRSSLLTPPQVDQLPAASGDAE